MLTFVMLPLDDKSMYFSLNWNVLFDSKRKEKNNFIAAVQRRNVAAAVKVLVLLFYLNERATEYCFKVSEPSCKLWVNISISICSLHFWLCTNKKN